MNTIDDPLVDPTTNSALAPRAFMYIYKKEKREAPIRKTLVPINRMRKAIIIVVCFFSSVLDLFSQGDNSVKGVLAPPDTFPTYKFKSIQLITSLDSLGGRIVDTLYNPTAFLIDTLEFAQYNYWCIAIKKKDGFVVFDPFENIEINAKEVDAVVTRKQFDGKGSDELIIEWTQQMWHHSGRAGFDAVEGGIAIINLDNLTRLMYYQTLLSSSSWQNFEEPDTTGDSLAEPTLITVDEERFEKYLVSISNKRIVIHQECRTPDSSEKDQEPQIFQCDQTVYNYRFTKKGLIRKK